MTDGTAPAAGEDLAVAPSDLTVDLSGTVAVVIGASQGIGAAIAVALAASGSQVIAAARNTEGLERTRAASAPASAHPVDVRTVDVTTPDSIAALAEAVTAAHGAPTILVNSAGGALSKPAFDVTVGEWDDLMHTHVRGTWLACQAFGRAMARAGYGKIINLSSTWAVTVAPNRSAYAVAKAAVDHMTAALATEWAPVGIRVNAIAPTATLTPRVVAHVSGDPARERHITDRIPLGRLATTGDVVGSALFLASRAADFVTGHTLFVDGGWRASK